MLSEKNKYVEEAAVTLRKLTDDDKIRLQCEARERYEMDRRSLIADGKREQKEIDEAIIAEKDAMLKKMNRDIIEKDREIEELKKINKKV